MLLHVQLSKDSLHKVQHVSSIMQRLLLEGPPNPWRGYTSVINLLALLPAERWEANRWSELATVVGTMIELSQLYAPPMTLNSKDGKGVV
jgi:hypothetical protein